MYLHPWQPNNYRHKLNFKFELQINKNFVSYCISHYDKWSHCKHPEVDLISSPSQNQTEDVAIVWYVITTVSSTMIEHFC